MSQYDNYDIDSDNEIEVDELSILLSILKAQGIDINEYLRGLILLSTIHHLWGKTTPPPPSTTTMTRTLIVSTTPILSRVLC